MGDHASAPPGVTLASLAFRFAGVLAVVAALTALWEARRGMAGLAWLTPHRFGVVFAFSAAVGTGVGLLGRAFAIDACESAPPPSPQEVVARLPLRRALVIVAVVSLVTAAVGIVMSRNDPGVRPEWERVLSYSAIAVWAGLAVTLADRVTGRQARFWEPVSPGPRTWRERIRGPVRGYVWTKDVRSTAGGS